MFLLLFYFAPSDIMKSSVEPPIIKGVYLSPGVIYSDYGLDDVYKIIDLNLINTVVLDIKDEKGRVLFNLYEDFIKEAKKKKLGGEAICEVW